MWWSGKTYGTSLCIDFATKNDVKSVFDKNVIFLPVIYFDICFKKQIYFTKIRRNKYLGYL